MPSTPSKWKAHEMQCFMTSLFPFILPDPGNISIVLWCICVSLCRFSVIPFTWPLLLVAIVFFVGILFVFFNLSCNLLSYGVFRFCFVFTSFAHPFFSPPPFPPPPALCPLTPAWHDKKSYKKLCIFSIKMAKSSTQKTNNRDFITFLYNIGFSLDWFHAMLKLNARRFPDYRNRTVTDD